MYMIF